MNGCCVLSDSCKAISKGLISNDLGVKQDDVKEQFQKIFYKLYKGELVWLFLNIIN